MACGLENGLIVRALPGDAAALWPPLIIKDDEIDDMVERLGRTLDDTLDALIKEGARAAE